MQLTQYQAKTYANVHGQVKGQNIDELKALLKLSEQLDEIIDGEDGEDGEVDDELMKKCYGILKRFKPAWKADERIIDMLEKIEEL